MHPVLSSAIEGMISRSSGCPVCIRECVPVGGGCINEACVIKTSDGRRYFVKFNSSPLPRMFECEAAGLTALSGAQVLRVPRPVGTGGGEGNAPSFIVMEFIESGRRKNDFFEEFGRCFARLHQSAQNARFGFVHDNYIGSTPQPNTWHTDWTEFWREQRLGYQLALARRKGLTDAVFNRLGDRLLERLPEFIAEPVEPPCLLHGDLWSGNFMADEKGDPVIYDPACYYGRREADLAMTRLFGGFSEDFYAAYEEIWPLAPDSEVRLDLYMLYHLLNHLNLFGSGYLSSCLAILRRYAG